MVLTLRSKGQRTGSLGHHTVCIVSSRIDLGLYVETTAQFVLDKKTREQDATH